MLFNVYHHYIEWVMLFLVKKFLNLVINVAYTSISCYMNMIPCNNCFELVFRLIHFNVYGGVLINLWIVD